MRTPKWFWIACVVSGIGLAASRDVAAVPVEYVKVCSVYGAGYFYVPGTDVCLNAMTNDARQQTAGGVWRWRSPNTPHTWAAKPQDACKNGRLVKVGDFSSANLAQNAYGRYEGSSLLTLALKSGQYIGAVTYQGGLSSPQGYAVADLPACPAANAFVVDATDTNCTAGAAPVGGGGATSCEVACVGNAWQFTGNQSVGRVGAGTFCLYYRYDDPTSGDPVYSPPLGCIDTAARKDVAAALVFAPEQPLPPATDQPVVLVGAAAEDWQASAIIQGTLSVSVCLQRVKSGRGR